MPTSSATKSGSRRWKPGWPISTWAWAEVKGMFCSAGAASAAISPTGGSGAQPVLAGRRDSSVATSAWACVRDTAPTMLTLARQAPMCWV